MKSRLHPICNARLTMNSSQIVDGQTNTDRTEYDACYTFRDGTFTLEFMEQGSTPAESVRTRIICDSPDAVTISRRGGCNAEMHIVPQQDHDCDYETTVGTLALTVRGVEIKSRLTEQGGILRLKYQLLSAGNPVSENTVSLHIKRK